MKISKYKKISRIVNNTKSTETILEDDGNRPSSLEHNYPPRKFTERQENFYQNLLRLYRLTKSKQIPVYFTDGDGNNLRLDRGCIAMAVHDGFLSQLKDNSSGFLETVTLNW